MVVPRFVQAAIKNEPVRIYGTGKQTRCFCYVDDLIAGLVALMKYDGADAFEPVNLGSGDERSMNDIVACLGEILGRKLDVEYHPLPENDPIRRRPDTTRAKTRLGWQPRTTLQDGLRRTVDYFRSVTKSAEL
jgi:nucleoside-diphosphate-sugar epimerase